MSFIKICRQSITKIDMIITKFTISYMHKCREWEDQFIRTKHNNSLPKTMI